MNVDITRLQVDTDSPAFPRSTGYWWLGCSSAPRGTVGGNERLSVPAHYAHDYDDDDGDVGDILFDAGRFGSRRRVALLLRLRHKKHKISAMSN